jgi:hypothetical protein
MRDTTEESMGEIGKFPSLHNISVKVPIVVGRPPIEMLSLTAIVLPASNELDGWDAASSHRCLQALRGFSPGLGNENSRGTVVGIGKRKGWM